MALSWEQAWSIAGMVVASALVIAVLALGFARRVNRAFALALVVGIGHALTTLVAFAGSPAEADLAGRLYPYFNLNDEIALLWFVSVYTGWPRRLHAGPWAAIVFASVSIALMATYVAAPDLYFGGGTPAGLYGDGPLAILDFHVWMSHTIVALVLAVTYFRAEVAERSASALLTSAAVALNSLLYHPAMAVGSISGAYELKPELMVGSVLHGLLALGLLAYVGVQGVRAREADARSAARRYAVALGLVAAFSAARPWLPAWTAYGFQASSSVGILLLAYALLRHQLFGLDRKVRFALSKSTIAAAFVAAFFLASEAAQLVLGQENPYLGLVGAGALVFAMAPLQRAAERLAERAVPVAADPASPIEPAAAPAHHARREEAYRDALRIALQDRRLTRDEEVRLHRLADELGIAPSRAHKILVDVEREQGVA